MHTRMNFSRFRYRLMILVFLAGLCAVAGVCARAQAQIKGAASEGFGHQAWSSENGLPQNSVHQILQTRDGYIWIATEGGVARFNGIQFTIFNQENDPAFTSNDTCCLPLRKLKLRAAID